MASSDERKRPPWLKRKYQRLASDDLSAIDHTIAAPDFNQQLFASGQMQGSLGAHGGGADPDGRKSSVPLLAMLGVKDARGWVDIFNAPGILPGGTNGIGGIFTPKSGDKLLQAFQNTGPGNGTAGIGEPSGTHFQSIVAASRGESGERSVKG